MTLQDKLAACRFVITAEVTPPASAARGDFLAKALPLKDVADAVNVTDGAGARPHLAAVTAAAMLVDAIDALEETHFATTYPVLKRFGEELETAMRDSAEVPPVTPPLSIDYVDLFSRDKARARRARERVLGR